MIIAETLDVEALRFARGIMCAWVDNLNMSTHGVSESVSKLASRAMSELDRLIDSHRGRT